MKVNSINTFNYSNINNNKSAYRPVFKQNETTGIARQAIVDQFVEATNKKDIDSGNILKKISFLKNVLLSKENDEKSKALKETLSHTDLLDFYDSTQNILFKI